MLTDRITGDEREVDVLIGATVAGHAIAIGVETRDHKRVQGVDWVEQVASKHERLPINQSVCVSRSGFSKPARALASRLGIELVTPGQEISDVGPLAGLGVQVEAREVSWSGQVRAIAWMLGEEGQRMHAELAPGVMLFASDGAPIGNVLEVVEQIRENLEGRGETALAEEDAKWLVYELAPPVAEHPVTGEPTPFHLKHGETGELLPPVEGLQVAFSVDVRIAQVDLEFGGLQGVEFAVGVGEVNEHRALVVLTEQGGAPQTAIRVTNRDGETADLGESDMLRVQLTREQAEKMQARLIKRRDPGAVAPEVDGHGE